MYECMYVCVGMCVCMCVCVASLANRLLFTTIPHIKLIVSNILTVILILMCHFGNFNVL